MRASEEEPEISDAGWISLAVLSCDIMQHALPFDSYFKTFATELHHHYNTNVGLLI